MQSVLTHNDRWRWYVEMDSASGSACADDAFPANGVKIKTEGNGALSVAWFCIDQIYHPGERRESPCAQRQRSVRHKSFTWISWQWESVAWLQSNRTVVLILHFSVQLGSRRSFDHLQKSHPLLVGENAPMLQMPIYKYIHANCREKVWEINSVLILEIHKWLSEDDKRLLCIGHLFICRTLLL